MDRDQALREHVLYLLRDGGAHLGFEEAIAGIPESLRGGAARAAGIPHTPWRLLEHMRICQWDILRYILDPAHDSPPFPDGYWPATDGPADGPMWEQSVAAFRSDLEHLQKLVMDPAVDLLAPIEHAQPGHTVLREVLIVADHNAYHLGQLIALRRALGAWNE